MDFDFTKKQLAIQKMIRDFVDKEVKPYAADADQKEIFPAEQIKKLSKLGVMGMSIPKKYGGPGYSHILENVVPLMREKGMPEEHIRTILVENPKRLLQAV